MLHQENLTDYHADSAECCPTEGLRHVLAVGTYQLDESSQQRLGRIHLYTLHPGNPSPPAQTDEHEPGASSAIQPSGRWSLQQQTALDVPGVFDMKWAPDLGRSGPLTTPSVLGTALADGSVRLYRVSLPSQLLQPALNPSDQGGAGEVRMSEESTCQGVSEGMALALDWQSTGTAGSSSQRIAVSGSSGKVAVLQVREDSLQQLVEWQAHDLEAWCVAFSRVQPAVVYTGADDCCFKAWDTRISSGHQGECISFSSPGDEEAPTCLHTNRKAHGAGVCTISPHPMHDHVLATGSYDERVRLWDARAPSQPLITSQVSTGGGNWRLRWHPHLQGVLVAACMYGGFAILGASSDYHALSVLENYQGHESIAYGVDWFRPCRGMGSEDLEQDLIASCSFYDRLLHLWSPSMPLTNFTNVCDSTRV